MQHRGMAEVRATRAQGVDPVLAAPALEQEVFVVEGAEIAILRGGKAALHGAMLSGLKRLTQYGLYFCLDELPARLYFR